MAASAFPREERIGLAAAILAHVALVAFLVMRPESGDIVVPPERITVTMTDEVGLISTSPAPSRDAAPDVAPTIGEASTPEYVAAEEQLMPVPPVARPAEPRPAPVATRRPPAKQEDRPDPAPPKATRQPRPAQKSGGSRLGSDFLEGVANTSEGRSTSSAATFGSREQASLASAISRQLRPHWSAPQGADAELLVTVVRFKLAKDGSLIGEPRVLKQTGRTEANAAQVPRHAEQAIRAVKLAAPFDLPVEFYDHWQTITSNFDRNLSR